MSRPKNNPGLPSWCGEALRLHRLHGNWSSARLGEAVGVTATTIRRWELGTHIPEASMVAKLASTLDVPRTAFAKEPRLVS